MNLTEWFQRLGLRFETMSWKTFGKMVVVKIFDALSYISEIIGKSQIIVFYIFFWWIEIPYGYAKKLLISRNSYANNLLNFEKYITATSIVGMITVFILLISQINELNWFYILSLVLLFQVTNFLGFMFTLLFFKVKYAVEKWKKELGRQKQKTEDGEFHHLRIKQIERWEESEKASEEKLEQYGGNN